MFNAEYEWLSTTSIVAQKALFVGDYLLEVSRWASLLYHSLNMSPYSELHRLGRQRGKEGKLPQSGCWHIVGAETFVSLFAAIMYIVGGASADPVNKGRKQ